MEIYAAPVGLKNGCCQQMVQINQHGGQQYKINFFPLFSKKEKSNKKGKNKVQKVVEKWLHFAVSFLLYELPVF